MENLYSNTNASTGSKTYIENKQYYNFAQMPITSPTYQTDPSTTLAVRDAMGFAGLVTKTDNGALPDYVSKALFSSTKNATENFGQEGALYKYGCSTAQEFIDYVNGPDFNNKPISEITNFVNDISSSIKGFDNVVADVASKSTAEDKLTVLRDDVAAFPWEVDNEPDYYFTPYNVANASATRDATFELNDPYELADPVIASTYTKVGSRLRAEQISPAEVQKILDTHISGGA
jgi:hypothetical protein